MIVIANQSADWCDNEIVMLFKKERSIIEKWGNILELTASGEKPM